MSTIDCFLNYLIQKLQASEKEILTMLLRSEMQRYVGTSHLAVLGRSLTQIVNMAHVLTGNRQIIIRSLREMITIGGPMGHLTQAVFDALNNIRVGIDADKMQKARLALATSGQTGGRKRKLTEDQIVQAFHEYTAMPEKGLLPISIDSLAHRYDVSVSTLYRVFQRFVRDNGTM